MALKCDYCSKGRVMARQSRHRKGVAGKQWAKRAQVTLKVFKPNLQWTTIDGVRLRLCTKCLKKLKNQSAKIKIDEKLKTTKTVVTV